MENYKNARDLLKKQLFDKLVMDRFSWDINIGIHKFVIEPAITKEEHIHRLKMIDHVINHLLFELDTYLFEIACNPEYKNIPTIFCLLNAKVDFDDTPIKEEDVYVVDVSTLQRTPDYEKYAENSEEVDMGNILKDDYNSFPVLGLGEPDVQFVGDLIGEEYASSKTIG